MFIILSPAKNMQSSRLEGLTLSRPRFLAQTEQLVETLRKFSPWQLERPMSVNPDLALKAFDSFQSFDPDAEGTAALLAYHGLQYRNLDPQSFSLADFAFANDHLRLLSAFYGVLRPTDGILPYRLEFLCKLKFGVQNLYQFWGDLFYRDLFSSGKTVINLASAEYSRTVQPYLTPHDRFLTCNFLVMKRGKPRMLATAAKMARGRMARYIVKERIDDPEGLKDFCWNGYTFIPHLSDDSTYTFLQRE